MTYDVIETDKYRMQVHDNGLLEYIIKPGITLEAEDLIEGRKRVKEKFPDGRFFVLAEGLEFFGISAEARAVSAGKDYLDNTLAVAFYTSNASIFLLGEMYRKLNKPAVPTQFFYYRDNAEDWLNEQAERLTGRKLIGWDQPGDAGPLDSGTPDGNGT